MTTFLVVGLASGLLLLCLDFMLNVNPLAQRMNAPYAPIARKQMPVAGAIVIDLLLGVAMAGLFLLLRPAFPGGQTLAAGFSFTFVAWFLRVLMGALSHWVMFQLPPSTLLYSTAAGLFEMAAIGLFYAWAFRSFP